MVSQPHSDSLRDWLNYYLKMAVEGVRSEEVGRKIELHLNRFQAFFEARYGQEYISSCVKCDVIAWQEYLEAQDLAVAPQDSVVTGFITEVRVIWALKSQFEPIEAAFVQRFPLK